MRRRLANHPGKAVTPVECVTTAKGKGRQSRRNAAVSVHLAMRESVRIGPGPELSHHSKLKTDKAFILPVSVKSKCPLP